MAARLARAKATVTVPPDDEHPGGQELKGVSVIVRENIATVRLGQEVLVTRQVVARVEVLGRRSWALHFEGSDDVWTIVDERRACCGSR